MRYIYFFTIVTFFSLTGMQNQIEQTYTFNNCVLEIKKNIVEYTIEERIKEKSLKKLYELSLISKEMKGIFEECISFTQKNNITQLFTFFTGPHGLSRKELCKGFGWTGYTNTGKQVIAAVKNCKRHPKSVADCIKFINTISQNYPDIINYTWYNKTLGMASLLMDAYYNEKNYDLVVALLENGCAADSARFCNVYKTFNGRTVLSIALFHYKQCQNTIKRSNILYVIKKLLEYDANSDLYSVDAHEMYTSAYINLPHNAEIKNSMVLSVTRRDQYYEQNIALSTSIYTLFTGVQQRLKNVDKKSAIENFLKIYTQHTGLVIRSYARETPLQGYLKYYLQDENNILYLSPQQSLANITSIVNHASDDLGYKDRYGNTVLHTAAATLRSTHPQELMYKVISLLVKKYNEKKISIYAKNRCGKTCIHIALEQNNMNAQIFNLLMHGKADINTADNDENTPLHYAIRGRNQSIIDMLIKKGACTENISREDMCMLEKYNSRKLLHCSNKN